MTLNQLKFERDSLLKKLEAINQKIENYGDGKLFLKDKEMQFCKWSLKEQQNLRNVNESAIEWFSDDKNRSKTVADYNACHWDNERIILAKD